jgi:hypothetical protein
MNTSAPSASSSLPRALLLLVFAYTATSLAHFVHNAELLEFYPNMPRWITRETIYQVWLAVAGIGALGLLLAHVGWPAVGASVLAVYGALGLDGLGHYSLALCSQHTIGTNVTIWSEVIAGLSLAAVAGKSAVRNLRVRRAVRAA